VSDAKPARAPKGATGVLILADGTTIWGRGFGAEGHAVGEVCFNTAMTGYQEVMTDPSYAGQIVTFTFPHIGNVGTNPEDIEADTPAAVGCVVRQDVTSPSNFRSAEGFDAWMKRKGRVGLSGVDTRALTRRIRERGAMTACVAAGSEFRVNDLLEEVRAFPSMSGQDLAREVTCARSYPVGAPDADFHVVAFDYGMKRSILKNLLEVGCRVTVVPAHWTAAQVLELEPDGVFLSNGPGDPEPVDYAVEAIRGLLGRVPVFGICLGHQLLALAVGFKTYKLKFGHRGINHPVKNYLRDAIEITSQNHGFAVESLPLVAKVAATGGDLSAIDPALMIADSTVGAVQVTHLNLNDGTVEGVRLRDVPAFSVQYHPEAGPGPHDSIYLFREFVELMKGWKARE